MSALSSGPVPREVIPGIEWCHRAEVEFVRIASEFLRKLGDSAERLDARESALREARWVVEIRLHQRFCKARVLEAGRCATPDAKRRLVADWTRLYGEERTERLLRMVRHEGLKQTVVEKW